METPSLPLAIEDFLSVVLSGIGLFFIARLIARLDRNCGHLASLGFSLIALGGLSHAIGALIFALTELYSSALYHTQWILLAPGFVLTAWAIWKTFHSGPSGTPVWVVPVIIIVIGCGAAAISALSKGGERWFSILLGLMLVAAAVTSSLLAWQAWRRGLKLLTALFIFHVVMIGVQSGLARLATQTVFIQWIEQINSTFAWAAFAYAAWQLEQSIVKKRNEA
jgi:hypothetical protein